MPRTMIPDTGLVVVAVLAVALPSAASAQRGSAGRTYGDHVAGCAQNVGYDSAQECPVASLTGTAGPVDRGSAICWGWHTQPAGPAPPSGNPGLER